VRYEDLVNNPKPELENIYKFLLEVDDLTGTNAQRRIDEIIAMGDKASQVYAKKATTGKFNTHRERYSNE